jgi:hypothetical protein
VQRECEVALTRVNTQIEEFEHRKEHEKRAFNQWMLREREQLPREREEV